MRVRSTLPRLLAATAIATAVMIPVASASAHSSNSGANAAVKRIFVIMLENHSQSTVIGNPNTPFINSLAANYGQATNYYGVTHPSQPNYVAAITGQLDPAHMNDIATNHFGYQNLVDQLESHGRTWAAYMDAMPSARVHRCRGPEWRGAVHQQAQPVRADGRRPQQPVAAREHQALHGHGRRPQLVARTGLRLDQP